jgi:hypothetical protein
MKGKDGMTTGAGMNNGTNNGMTGADKGARNPSSSGNVGPGTDNNTGRK